MPHPILNTTTTLQASATSSTTLVKSGPGTLHRIIAGCDLSANAVIDFAVFLYDSATTLSLGTPILGQRCTTGFPMQLDIDFNNGLVAKVLRPGAAGGSVCIVFS